MSISRRNQAHSMQNLHQICRSEANTRGTPFMFIKDFLMEQKITASSNVYLPLFALSGFPFSTISFYRLREETVHAPRPFIMTIPLCITMLSHDFSHIIHYFLSN